jgi:hypothetical protein
MKRDIWVDFNDEDEHGLTYTLLEYAREPSKLAVGSTVIAGDDEGNLCRGLITDITGHGVVAVALDLATFATSSKAMAITSAGSNQ